MEYTVLNIKSDLKYFISKILWWPTISLIYVHIGAIYGVYLCITCAKWQTIVMIYILGKHLKDYF